MTTSPADGAAVELAKRYAEQLDEAAELAAELARVEPVDEQEARTVAALAKRVEAAAVLAELGPRLLAVLVELGMTPKARAAVVGGKGARGDDTRTSAAAVARDRARQRHAAAVDAAAS